METLGTVKVAALAVLLGMGWAAPVGAAEVAVRKTKEGRWELRVDGRPYFIKGVDYRVTRVGESPDQGTLKDWAYYDANGNGKSDGPYDSWVDANRNGRHDPDEPAIGDFELMRRMGANTIRWYVNDFKKQEPDKALLRDLHQSYGIRVAVGNKFGAYTIDSGATWGDGTDYTNPEQRARLLESVRRMVLEHKDEPYVLIWLLGNENNYAFTNTNAWEFPGDYARLLEEAAQLIHELDGKHPVALVNGDTDLIEVYAKLAPSIDIFGTNAYRGPKGFGSLWHEVKSAWDRPVLIVEYGGSAAPGSDEEAQAAYHQGCWLDIAANRGTHAGSAGNAIGGFAFEWLDEWWKAGGPFEQAAVGTTGKQGKGEAKWSQEYCGIAGQGDGGSSPFLRELRRAYTAYQTLWREEK